MILNCIKCGHLYLAHEEPGGCMAAGDCNCTLDKVAVLLGCIAALEAENAKLRATLEEAREIIHVWHNMDPTNILTKTEHELTWRIYNEQSPEMKRINSALLAQEPA